MSDKKSDIDNQIESIFLPTRLEKEYSKMTTKGKDIQEHLEYFLQEMNRLDFMDEFDAYSFDC